jgi:hypothetical protein
VCCLKKAELRVVELRDVISNLLGEEITTELNLKVVLVVG